MTRRRRLIAPLVVTAAAGTWYALSPGTPETVEYRFSVNFDCDGDGQFSLRDWHAILNTPPEALGSPLVAWTAIMGKGD